MREPKVGERFDRYLIEERLGAGGMGEVFRAQDTKLRRQIALKVVRASAASDGGSAAEGAARLLREARAAAALDHPNAVAIFDVGELDGCAYIAMELVDGRNMRAYVGDASVPTSERVRWLVDVARALASAHRRGLVHRDVKPENVMIRSDGAVKVLDFGIARRFGGTHGAPAHGEGDTITRDGVMIGTPSYMAPEQLRGEAIDGRADQFAWGVLAYELLTGARPWPTHAGGVHLLAAILAHSVEPLAHVVNDLAPEVSEAVERALSKSVHDRFADMDALVLALGGKRAAVTPSARAPSSAPDPHTPDPLAATRTSVDTATKAPPAVRRWAAGIALAALAACGAVALSLRGQAPRAMVLPSGSPSSPSASSSSSATPADRQWSERRLTAFAAENRIDALAVTADGSAIAYADDEGVWTVPVAGGARLPVPMPKELCGARRDRMDLGFFPDGQSLLVGCSENGADATWIVPLDGSSPTPTRSAPRFALSPDGQRVAFVRDDAVVVGAVLGGATTRVLSLRSKESAVVAWSPHGDMIAVFRHELMGFAKSLELVAADGAWTRVLVSGAQFEHTTGGRPTWTAPDRVAFVQTVDEEMTFSEQLLDAAHGPAGAPRHLWRGPLTFVSNLTFRAGRLFYIRTDSQRDVYVGRLSADGSKLDAPLVRFTNTEANDSVAGWLPDGRVLFTSMRDGKARVYAQAIGARSAEAIVGSDEMVAVGALANGDVVAVRHDGATSSVVVAVPGRDASASRELFSLGSIVFRSGRVEICARCSTKAPSRCVIGAPSGDDVEIFTFDPATGTKSTPLVRHDTAFMLLNCSLSADGSTLYLPQQDVVRVVTLATGAERVIKGPSKSHLQYVSPLDGRSSLVSGISLFDQPYVLARMDERGRMDRLWSSTTLWIWSPFVAPNGRDLAATVRLFDDDVFVLAPSAH